MPLRDVWPHEALSFTPWLAQEDNLKLLGEAIGIELILEAQEKGCMIDSSAALFMLMPRDAASPLRASYDRSERRRFKVFDTACIVGCCRKMAP